MVDLMDFKKISLLLLVLWVGFSSALCGQTPDNQFGKIVFFKDKMVLDALTDQPLHGVYVADPWSAFSRFQNIQVQGSGPSTIRASVIRDDAADISDYPNATDAISDYTCVYQDIPFQDPGSDHLYFGMKIGFNLGLGRLTWVGTDQFPRLAVEFSLQGALNLVFNATGGTDMLGSDGIYFIGANASIGDTVSLRIGTHHFSGHYGDEILERLFTYGDNHALFNPQTPDAKGHIVSLLNYVRQDTLIFGISYQPTPWLRVYAEADIPPATIKTIRPWVHVPQSTLDQNSGAELEDRIGSNEGNLGGRQPGDEYGDGYRALRLQSGIEIRIPNRYLGDLTLALDLQFHQDGQTLHQVGSYDPRNPWDIEYNLVASQQIGQDVDGIAFSLEYIYHSGRFPLKNFFNVPCEYHSIGLGLRF